MSLHIEAKPCEIADRILLPGDPLRAKYIAETFLDNAACYNQSEISWAIQGRIKENAYPSRELVWVYRRFLFMRRN